MLHQLQYIYKLICFYTVSLTVAVLGIFLSLCIDLITHHCLALPEVQYSKLDFEIPGENDSNDDIKFRNFDGISRNQIYTNPLPNQIGCHSQFYLNSKIYMLESAIAVHSVILGFGFGAINQDDSDRIKILTLAFCFHQFFEGIGLAASVAKSSLKSQTIIGFGLVFVSSYLIGAVIGIFSQESGSSALCQGLADAFASGILIQAVLVEMIHEDFSQQQLNSQPMLKVVMFICLVLGFACMAVLACFE
jgi:zinc transporter ZupT